MWSLKDFKEKLGFAPWPEDHANQKPLEFLWSFSLSANPEDLWYYLADTSRFNREIDLAPRQSREENGRTHVTTTMLGLKQEWVEEPWTWIAGRTVSANRRYTKGIAKYFRAVFHVEPSNEPGRSVVYIYFGWFPSHPFWSLFLKVTMPVIGRRFEKAFDKIVAHLNQAQVDQKKSALQVLNKDLPSEGLSKLKKLRDDLIEKNIKTEILDRLVKHIETADEDELYRLRVLSLSKQWKVDKKDLLVVCLHAARAGMLNISWDVICPHCRGVRHEAQNLGDIPAEFDCDVCQIDFKTDRLDSIEVTFHVHPSIRQVGEAVFCSAEPAKKSHIRIQQVILPGQEMPLTAGLREGRHRVRKIGGDHSFHFQVVEGRANEEVFWDGTMSVVDAVECGSRPTLKLKNPGPGSAVYVLEELWWENQALRPVELFTLTEFRDLFSEEHLSTDVKLLLGQQTVMFTDIVGSTKFYQNSGDARAFKDVRDHFVEVFHEVKKKNGVVVKTIGDSVMAAFHTPEEALAAAIEIQMRFHENRSDTPIRLRISVHTGPVIAVHLHQGIDYFGGTVNMAAKLQACADAHEIALSEDVFRICSISFEKALNFPLSKRQSPTPAKAGTPLEAFVIKIDRRQTQDRRKSA